MSFKDIAASYNKINEIPHKAAQQLGKVFIALTGKNAAILDIGAGAGRITLPIAEAGGKLTALDTEQKMLDELDAHAREKNLAVNIVQGDALALPFADNSFDVVFTSNVLHLVADWETALDEAIRVMKPNGLLIQGRDWLTPESCAGRIRTQMRKIMAELDPSLMPTAAAGPALFQALEKRGGKTDPEMIGARWTELTSPAEILERMAARTHNETWQIDEGVFREAIGRIRKWTTEQWVRLDRTEEVEKRFLLYVTRALKR
ncbi:MAG: hypothetical protein HY22_12535 [[Candidatus Thermochlorobacteriaceae] bacterium GBChlB]|nr:MAG: hypothetical protein HY22_12535 [[Candidatus Thermochlorobacteriaceae] bacterium GBChlB]